ncbi:MAG: regulatory protein RecX [Betaproteobacteria bacterium]|jgi:Uncharacterized protein conserved in bacteria|nr:regulatory protein RecX [Betaproteobacteria bacterium]
MSDPYQRALRWLAQRERSRWDIRQRLADIPAEECEALLDRLEREGYLSDRRVAESLQRRAARGHGVQRLRHDLRQHGIDAELARPVLEEALRHELEVARRVRDRRFPQWPITAEERLRQIRYLGNRGFGAETIRQVLMVPPSFESEAG